MAGYYCTRCSELGRKCPDYHNCECGNLGLVWEDGWVECDVCVRIRISEGGLHEGST